MRTYLFFWSFLLIEHFAFSQVNDERSFLLGTYNKEFIKSSRIETVNVILDAAGQRLTRQYSFDSIGNLIYLVTIDSKGKKKGESFWRYNQYSSKVFQKNIDYEYDTADSSLYEYQYINNKVVKETSQPSNYIKEYVYNKNGKIEKTLTKNNDGVISTTEHSYDDQGNEVEYVWIQGDTRRMAQKTYDNKNRVSEYKEIVYSLPDTAGELFLHKKYIYGPNGKVAREEFLGGYFDLEKEIQEFLYNQDNNLVEQKSGKNKQTFSYDERGFLIKKETPLFGKRKSTETYTYTIRQ